MSNLYCYLCGGLGNQMFQYAAARAIAQQTKKQLIVDTKSGFVRDREFKRSYELQGLPLHKYQTARGLQFVPIWLERIRNKITTFQRTQNKQGFHLCKRLYAAFLYEDNRYFYKDIFNTITDNTWLLGYFQSPLYFKSIASSIRGELTPSEPQQKHLLALGNNFRARDTVAVGLRLYEETKDPSQQASDNITKTISEYREVLRQLLEQLPEVQIALFCTHRADCLQALRLSSNVHFVTHDDGYVGAKERLWLLTQCRHHLFNNSTFYWWGAWLSASTYGGPSSGQLIYAANNFINKDSHEDGWNSF